MLSPRHHPLLVAGAAALALGLLPTAQALGLTLDELLVELIGHLGQLPHSSGR